MLGIWNFKVKNHGLHNFAITFLMTFPWYNNLGGALRDLILVRYYIKNIRYVKFYMIRFVKFYLWTYKQVKNGVFSKVPILLKKIGLWGSLVHTC